MAKNGLKPEIRFAGFTEDWEQRKLGGVTDRVQGNDGRMGLPTLTISAANGWLDQKDRFYDNIAGNEQKNYTLLKKGQLSYNHGNSKLAKYGVIFELQNYDEALVPRVYHSFKAKENVAPSFIEYLFATKRPDKELGKLISSGARMDGLLNISFDDFMSIEIPVPTIKEQIKISSFFRTLDNLITLHQRKCEKLVNFKKAMLEKMFPKDGTDVPKIRFAGFAGAWEQRELKDLCVDTYGGGTPRTVVTEYWNGNIAWIQSSDLAEDKLSNVVPKKSITKNGLKNSTTKLIPENSIAIVTRVGVGKLAFMPYKYTTSQDFLSLSKLKVDNWFGTYSIWKKLQSKLRSVQGTSIKGIPKKELLAMTIMIPTQKEEQAEIGDFFHNLDHLITLQQRELEQLKQIKKSLLDKMFV